MKTKVFPWLLLFLCMGFYYKHQGFKSTLLFFTLLFVFIAAGASISLSYKIRKLPINKTLEPITVYPDKYFNYVFDNVEREISLRIIELQNKVVCSADHFSSDIPSPSIAISIQELEKEYANCISYYLNQFHDSSALKQEISMMKNRIQLLKDIVQSERNGFLVNNGNDTIDFNFNRQNYFTDIFLTGLAIPMLIKILDTCPHHLGATIVGNNIIFTLLCAFMILLFYRLFKYYKNKSSMRTSHTSVVMFYKLDLLISIFETAFANNTGSFSDRSSEQEKNTVCNKP